MEISENSFSTTEGGIYFCTTSGSGGTPELDVSIDSDSNVLLQSNTAGFVSMIASEEGSSQTKVYLGPGTNISWINNTLTSKDRASVFGFANNSNSEIDFRMSGGKKEGSTTLTIKDNSGSAPFTFASAEEGAKATVKISDGVLISFVQNTLRSDADIAVAAARDSSSGGPSTTVSCSLENDVTLTFEKNTVAGSIALSATLP